MYWGVPDSKSELTRDGGIRTHDQQLLHQPTMAPTELYNFVAPTISSVLNAVQINLLNGKALWKKGITSE